MNFTPFQTPPPGFFTVGGIYQHRYDPSVVATFNQISTMTYVDSSGVLDDPFNNPYNVFLGQFLSIGQLDEYKQQFSLFRTVYQYNSNQWVTQTKANPARPYRFYLPSDQSTFRQSLGIVNKLYNVVEGLSLTDIFILPFPPFAASFPNPTV